MSKVYKHKPKAPDEYLGRVEPDGKVYERRSGPDKKVGWLEIHTGNIHETRFGPDKRIGRVDLDSGKIFLTKFGPDQYVGRVEKDGKLFHHKSLSSDDYLGKIKDMPSFGHGGAAFLLLVSPTLEEEAPENDQEQK